MPGLQSVTINLSEKEAEILQSLANGTHRPGHLKQRATFLLKAAAGQSNSEIARELHVQRNIVKKWRHRYAKAAAEIRTWEAQEPRKLRRFLTTLLQDAPRPGRPATFTHEQVARILSLALEKPADYGVQASHWTPTELARQAVKAGIVASISHRSVSRFLKGGES